MVLFMSNGHGEDLIATHVMAWFLQSVPKEEVLACPLVGTGGAYQRLGVAIMQEGRELPSGGFARQSLGALYADLRAGLLSLTLRQIKTLKEIRKKVTLGVVVGDIYPLLLGALFLKRPLAFLPTAKSDYIRGHNLLEIQLMKAATSMVFPRDEKTAASLRSQGVSATFLGNVMMDAFAIHGFSFGLSPCQRILGILPGSRREAFQNLHTILPALKLLQEREVSLVPVLALAPSLSLKELGENLSSSFQIIGGEGDGVEAVITGEEVSLFITRQGFGDLLQKAQLFIGLSGTANEQAAGMGKVVVAFPGEGPQFGPAFLQAQKRLLGAALISVERDPMALALEVERLFHNEGERSSRGVVGEERMGPPGGSLHISKALLSFLKGEYRAG